MLLGTWKSHQQLQAPAERCRGATWTVCAATGTSRRKLTLSTGSAASPRCCFNHRSTFPWHSSAKATSQLQHRKFGKQQARCQSCSSPGCSQTGCSQPSVQPGLELPSRKLCLSQSQPHVHGGWKGALRSSNPPSNHTPSTAKPTTEPCPQTPPPHIIQIPPGTGTPPWTGQPRTTLLVKKLCPKSH